MPLLDVNGTTVNFPYTPYDCQLKYLQKVLECLQTNSNGILESPTGTGKTLCLLCAALAWLQDRKAQTELNRQASISSLMADTGTLKQNALDKLAKNLEQSTGVTWGGSEFAIPKIIYASRTHSQLSQAVQELKRTAYNNVKVSVIGSRDQLCIHEHVRKETNNSNKIHMCRAKVAARTCHYYNRFEDIKRNGEMRTLLGDVVDIEDIVTYGEKQRVCPYYMSRELKGDADIIFMPYNYLLDPKTRMSQGVEIQGNVLIFDEAHNLERMCEDSSSFDLTPSDLATAIEELHKLSLKLLEMAESEENSIVESTDSAMPEHEFTVDEVLKLKSTLLELETNIDKIEITNKEKGLTKPGKFIFELFSSVNIGFESKNFFIDLLEKIVSYLTSETVGVGFSTKGAGLNKIQDVIKIIFSREFQGGSMFAHQEALSKFYKVHVQFVQQKQQKTVDTWAGSGKNTKMGKTVSYWCFSPGHRMLDLVACGVKCIILTSGTLSPLKSFSAEMQVPFPITLENPHVIEKHQIMVGTIGKGPDNVVLNSNYETRFKESYQASLGKAVVNFARVVPKGLLIFFPSYPVMEKCIENWQSNGIYNSISQYKPIYVEPRGKGMLDDVMNDFYEKIHNPTLNGAIFAAVCRGKVSEGLDFSDDNGRAVIITGLPYPPRMDPKVVLKMQFLDESRGKLGFQSLTGQEWYRQQASRAVNQAIGRVLRHKMDFGAILLCDTRFSAASAISQLPLWVKPHVKKFDLFGPAIKDVIVFFKTTEQKMPAVAPKPRRAGSSTGCGGSSFMPTVTRTSVSASAKARTVADHVPSLKGAQDDATALAKLKVQYDGAPVTNKSTKGGLLAALSTSRGSRFDVSLEENNMTANTDMKKMPGKKKIIIKKRDPLSGSSAEVAEVTSTVQKDSLKTAESYLDEVKKSLGLTLYKDFARALRDYKKDGEFGKCAATLASLLTRRKEDYKLFRQFYRFIRAKDKEAFNELCRDITGVGCVPKEEATSKKRLPSDNNADTTQPEKKQRTEVVSGVDMKQAPSNTVPNAAAATMCGLGSTLNHQKSNQITADTMGTDDVSAAKDRDGIHMASSGVTRQSDSSRIFNSQTEPQSQDMGSFSAQENTAPPNTQIRRKDMSGYTCCRCNSDARVPFQANCDHICCFKCWRQVFEDDKLCPGCKVRVRRRQLRQILFPTDIT